MATEFDYIHKNAALGVNLNRQKYGPLDGSSVFKSLNDLYYYIVASHSTTLQILADSRVSALYENADSYWKDPTSNATTYAYVGQVITVVDSNGVRAYKILDVPNALSDIPGIGSGTPKFQNLVKQIDDVDASALTGVSSALSIMISAVSSNLSSAIQFVSADTSSKIWIEDRISNLISGHSNLSVVKLSEDEYTVFYPNYNPNTIYIVESDNLNAYDAKVINVADGSENYDAVNVKQLKSLGSALTTDISAVSSVLTTDISAVSSVLTDEIQFVSSDTSSKIWIEDRISNLISGHSNLSVVKLTEEEYANLYPNYDPNSLYVVESDNLNAYGTKITNVADGEEDSDAANVKQIKSVSSLISRVYVENTEDDPRLSGVYTNLSVVKLTKNEYETIPATQLCGNTLYVVESPYMDAYGNQIKNLEDGTDLLDAVNVGQLNKVSVFLEQQSGNKIWIQNDEDGVAGEYSNLSVVKIDKQTYDQTAPSALNPKQLYILCADYVDAYGSKIKNVDDGTDIYDAVNVKQLSSVKNDIDEKINERIFDVSSDTMVKIQDLKDELGGFAQKLWEPLSVYANANPDTFSFGTVSEILMKIVSAISSAATN